MEKIQIKDLERKYGNTIEDILASKDKMSERLNLLLNSEQELERLKLNKQDLLNKIVDTCKKLRNIRIDEIKNFKAKKLSAINPLIENYKNAKKYNK